MAEEEEKKKFNFKKIALFGKDLDEFSLETVKMFYEDAEAAGYVI